MYTMGLPFNARPDKANHRVMRLWDSAVTSNRYHMAHLKWLQFDHERRYHNYMALRYTTKCSQIVVQRGWFSGLERRP